MATLPTFPISTASFTTNPYTFDPLYADDTISQSANIAGGLGVLKRGTVLCGPLTGLPITVATLLTTVVTGAQARVILAQDIDTTGGQVTGVVYTQGKFLDTAMTFSSQGAALDVAQLRQFGIYVLTVEQRSGMLVPLMKLPVTGGPLPQALAPKDAAKATKEEVEAIRAAQGESRGAIPGTGGAKDPAWYTAAFGEREPTKEEQAREKAQEQAADLDEKQLKARDELTAKQNKELSDLVKKQQDERAQLLKQEADAIQHARQANSAPAAPPKK
jgi:hypothetical protein